MTTNQPWGYPLVDLVLLLVLGWLLLSLSTGAARAERNRRRREHRTSGPLASEKGRR